MASAQSAEGIQTLGQHRSHTTRNALPCCYSAGAPELAQAAALRATGNCGIGASQENHAIRTSMFTKSQQEDHLGEHPGLGKVARDGIESS